MSTMSAEQYAHRVSDALVQRMRRAGKGSTTGMPTPDEAAQLILDTTAAPAQNPLASRIGPVWTSARARAALGLRTRQALSSRRANGTVLGITTTEGQVYYPLFQFRRQAGRVEVHPNLVPVLKALKDVDSWTVAAMLRATDPELGMSATEWATSSRDQARLRDWAQDVRRELTPR
ncbi:hypothetical protein [Ornithinimicrobium cavernae]|uniref:hypothetical protein n=1 Tax=Ornithinimicrobium cavernae TaxID=2666047 RepID=UPI00137A4F65|nr:hypothetical protein [Ornithinimicrobium cavernae]